jgi:hypothetical protein
MRKNQGSKQSKWACKTRSKQKNKKRDTRTFEEKKDKLAAKGIFI